MKTQLRQLATKLRIEQELSYSAIRKRLGVPKSTLSGWLKDLPLSEKRIMKLRRAGWQKGEAGRERYRNTMRNKRNTKDNMAYQKYIRKFDSLSENTHFVAGLMLYLAEGDKKDDTRIVLTNTDPKMMRFFIKWLIKFFDVNRKEIKIQLHLYEDMDIEEEKKFWYTELEIGENQLYKSQIRKLKESSFNYKDSVRHGTCQVYSLGVEKKREISMAIKAFLDQCS